MDNFDLLIAQGNLGFYNTCEVTNAFVIDRNTDVIYNYFTIFVFEERDTISYQAVNLAKRLIKISDRFSLGCCQFQIPLDQARAIYNNFKDSKDTIDIGKGNISIGHLKRVPKQFVPQNSSTEILINQVIKNNFKNGSYLLEYFDVDKPLERLMTKNEYKSAAIKLKSIIPIDLFVISDRVGNFIFQFPSKLGYITYHTDEGEENLFAKIKFDNRITNTSRYELLAEYDFDDTIVALGLIKEIKSDDFSLEVGDTSHLCRISLIDTEKNIIISRAETSFIRSIRTQMLIGSQFGNIRTIIDESGKLVIININSRENINVGHPISRKWEDYIKTRQYNCRMDELERKKEFIQYGITNRDDRERALKDIRYLMNRSEGNSVYLWDPYLDAQDLLDTWYYTSIYGLKLKAITSKEISEKRKMTVPQWINEQQHKFTSQSNQLGINIEFRCQWGCYGYGFHDRFLMIPNEDRTAKVWSLGASINGLGKKHHIVQLVAHPRHIIDAFEALWDELYDPSCLVWKSK